MNGNPGILAVAAWAVTLAMTLAGHARADRPGTDERAWIPAMREVHARFRGTPGTLAQFGDSITVTMAYWAPLRYADPQKLPAAERARWQQVMQYQTEDCWTRWKGPDYGSQGSTTIRWAHQHIHTWLKTHRPETAVIMFGTNDLTQVPLEEYEQKLAEVVEACLKQGTVVILSTIPPRSGMLEKSQQYAEAARRVAGRLKVPRIDLHAEILARRRDDWDGSLPKFDDYRGYEVPTLIARDGVHPSNPRSHVNDFTPAGLRSSGYTLRNYLTLHVYAEVIDQVLQPSDR